MKARKDEIIKIAYLRYLEERDKVDILLNKKNKHLLINRHSRGVFTFRQAIVISNIFNLIPVFMEKQK